MKCILIIGITALASRALGAIPSYIHVCKKNDPQIERCILKSVEALRPKLAQGIPELNVPSIEPLKLENLVLQHGGPMLKFQGSNFVVAGASKFEIQDFKADVKKLNFRVKIRFPKILITALYEVRGRFLSLNLQGNGPIAVTAENVEGNVVINGKKVTKDGKQYFILDSLDLKMNLKNYEVKLSKGFFNDPAVTDAINVVLRENKREIINLIRPRIQQVVKDTLLENANKITSRFTFDELFPEK
ncbi:Haemolymph juvenile hormone Hypothetical protein protein (JHBP) [Nesidiocoris tenuis]|uniref:Hemolymph juvenile hormone binding protein n=1 Tax=Nesidiocoris tenuis TaxID=355587 RepID=A0ABN7B087_9HEMI|nr:Haemolymph juvenile hormone Hypothetical protein protein (JHBP) [Nesidiocoris tenuis]